MALASLGFFTSACSANFNRFAGFVLPMGSSRFAEPPLPPGTLMAPCKGAIPIPMTPLKGPNDFMVNLCCTGPALSATSSFFGVLWARWGSLGVPWGSLVSPGFPCAPLGFEGFPAVSCGSPEGPLGASWMCASVLHVNGTTGGLPCAGAATSAISSLTLL